MKTEISEMKETEDTNKKGSKEVKKLGNLKRGNE